MPLTVYQSQNRGGKGITGAKTDEEDAIRHLFVASTHAWLLFFTDRGRVLWRKVYDIPVQSRIAKGRAIVNLLQLQESETVVNCVAVREFDDERFLIMATRKGVVKKTALSAYSRPLKGGIIAINLRDGDELVEARIVSPRQDVLLSTASGMAIRFNESDARAMGRNTAGVRGIKLKSGDIVIGMVVVESDMSLLTVCENGYGKRTPFGLEELAEVPPADEAAVDADVEAEVDAELPEEEAAEDGDEAADGNKSYRRQRRGGKGIRDIKTTDRNGLAVKILAVSDGDEVLLVTSAGKIQRIRVVEINEIGRNTQGVRVMRLDEDDKLVSVARIPAEVVELTDAAALESDVAPETDAVPPTDAAPPAAEPDAGAE